MAFYGFFNFCRIHFTNVMEQFIGLCPEISYNAARRIVWYNVVDFLNLFHQSIIINRNQLIIVLNIPFCPVMVWSRFQIFYNVSQCFPNCNIRIVINSTVISPMRTIVRIIISSHNGIIIASIHLLDTDIAVCNLKGKFGFFSVFQGLFHICKNLFLFITKVNDFITLFQRVVRSLRLLFLLL